jgi:serine protease Do
MLALLMLAATACAGLPEAVERVKPSVVAVGTFLKTRSPAFVFLGTGFAVGDGTLIATNAHVVSAKPKLESGETLMVLVHQRGTRDPNAREAKAVGLDQEHDLALLRIAGAPLPAVKFGDSDTVRDGQSIAFTGFPIGQVLGFHAVTHRGIVSSLTAVALPVANASQLDARTVERLKAAPIPLFQLDATIYAGNSGSPLYDEGSGEVLGIVNMGQLRGMKDPVIGQASNISFAVPIRFLQNLIANSR